jgi:hypothetical protein
MHLQQASHLQHESALQRNRGDGHETALGRPCGGPSRLMVDKVTTVPKSRLGAGGDVCRPEGIVGVR